MRLKELSFPAMKLSALIAIEGKKIIVAITDFLPQHCYVYYPPYIFYTIIEYLIQILHIYVQKIKKIMRN